MSASRTFGDSFIEAFIKSSALQGDDNGKYGILPPGILGDRVKMVVIAGFGTIIASFLAARFGASESRRQFTVTSQTKKLVAAGELILLLDKFQERLQDALYNNANYRSSDGQAGGVHFSFSKFNLEGNSHRLAATLGRPIVEDVILLLSKFSRAKGAVSATFEFVGGEEATDEFDKWAAALVLQTYDLINRINTACGIRIIAKPSQDRDELQKIADDRLADDEHTQLVKY